MAEAAEGASMALCGLVRETEIRHHVLSVIRFASLQNQRLRSKLQARTKASGYKLKQLPLALIFYKIYWRL